MKNLITSFGTIIFAITILMNCGSDSKNTQVSSGDTNTAPNEEISKKKSTLTKLKGEYKLNSIAATLGINSIQDYYIENGKWIATGSSISQGSRQNYDIDLSKDILTKLQSMKITIAEDLSLIISCNGMDYFKAPFQEEGFSYFISKSPKEYDSHMPADLAATSTFIGDQLYLFAKDNLTEQEVAYLDIAEVSADVVVITYNTKTNEFEMSLFYSECCDDASYVFK